VQPLRYPWEKPYAREQPTILADRTTVLKPYGKVISDKFSDGNITIEGVGISGDNAKLAIVLSCQHKGLMRFYADDRTRKAVESITLKAGFCNTLNRASPRNN
jgi:hypothetical protein